MNSKDTTHAILLHLLDQFTGEEAEALREELASTHESYVEQFSPQNRLCAVDRALLSKLKNEHTY